MVFEYISLKCLRSPLPLNKGCKSGYTLMSFGGTQNPLKTWKCGTSKVSY